MATCSHGLALLPIRYDAAVSEATQTASYTVEADDAGVRVDAYLATRLPWRSRRALGEMIGAGKVTINGSAVKKSRRVGAGDVVNLELPAVAIPTEALAAIALPVLYEDDDLVVVDKPTGLAVHPASTCPHLNALTRLQHRYRHETPDPTAEPSVIHRLDRGTSGVVAFARRRETVAFYAGQFEARTTSKEYRAIAHGAPPDHMRLDAALRAEDSKLVVVDPSGKPSLTEVFVTDRTADAVKVRIALHTGRKHQIRVHMANAGYPLLYDGQYGRTSTQDQWPDDARPMLHAAILQLKHRDGRVLKFEAPLPEDMRRTWAALKDKRGESS